MKSRNNITLEPGLVVRLPDGRGGAVRAVSSREGGAWVWLRWERHQVFARPDHITAVDGGHGTPWIIRPARLEQIIREADSDQARLERRLKEKKRAEREERRARREPKLWEEP